jgi:Ca-activated chloride channel family protein
MTRLLATLALLAALAAPRPALAWDWLRSENVHVADGNELMASGDPTAALAEYDLAARELPSEPGVHLDRGLALLAMGEYGRAREALQLASEPPASAEIRAMAHYDIGLSYYLEGDAASRGGAAAPAPSAPAGPLGALGGILGGGGPPAPTVAPASEPDHERARGLFREAADAFRDSLRQVPGNRDAGWNLELALRRITEEEEAQREEEEREEEENSESEESEESSEGERGDEEQPGEPSEEESEGGDGEESEESSEEGDGADESEESGAEEEGDPSSTGGGEEAPSEPDEGEGSETEAGGTTEDSLPPDMERVLDALETSEENLSAARARARGSAERRRVERDW